MTENQIRYLEAQMAVKDKRIAELEKENVELRVRLYEARQGTKICLKCGGVAV